MLVSWTALHFYFCLPGLIQLVVNAKCFVKGWVRPTLLIRRYVKFAVIYEQMHCFLNQVIFRFSWVFCCPDWWNIDHQILMKHSRDKALNKLRHSIRTMNDAVVQNMTTSKHMASTEFPTKLVTPRAVCFLLKCFIVSKGFDFSVKISCG